MGKKRGSVPWGSVIVQWCGTTGLRAGATVPSVSPWRPASRLVGRAQGAQAHAGLRGQREGLPASLKGGGTWLVGTESGGGC